ncbi:peptidoglycan D,D-transpeptidase FtsI family protein [Bacillus sp. JJ722]|uniref:peptidoglycan D,D-transpeptidase FtsI family protein n=1 Tax=Bacillus sp. JJ722 TaxID=3122973 RepID=UPI0030008773
MKKSKDKDRKKKSHIPFRLNILFFVVFLLFSTLILRLGIVQIVNGEDARRKLERTEEVTVNKPVPRGKIYDSTGKTIVDNAAVNAITYTRTQETKTSEMLDVAEKLAKLINKDDSKITVRDKQDFWILMNPKEAAKKITKEDKKLLSEEKIDDKEIYRRQLNRITEKEYNSLTKEQLEVLAIYREMASAKALTPQIIKTEKVKGSKVIEMVTENEVAIISEYLESLPGVDVITDWKRNYLFEDTLRSVIGKVSKDGLPLEKIDYYLTRDYNRNDRVGESYIEMAYEDVLHGQKEKVKNITDKTGKVIETVTVSEGQRGKDLILTIDMNLQRAVEKIIEDELREKKSFGGTYLLDRAFVVLMNPNTGDILTMAGKQYARDEETGNMEMNDFALGNITTSYGMGSAVKGATVLAGLQSKAINLSSGFTDSRLHIKGTPSKGSWKDLGYVGIETALQRSSNVFMFHTAINMGNGFYQRGMPLKTDIDALDKLRFYFNQFGLGVRTGIDLPNEMVGFKGPETNSGKLLDLSIGQYDTYTPMQLVQYVSTIANGGKRMQPHIVKEIREPSDDPNELGPIVKEISPKVLNTISMKQSYIKKVQKGFRLVMQSSLGTAPDYANVSYNPAGKTGTAESYYDGPLRKNYDEPIQTTNITLVGYAPYDNPEVAMAVVVPWAYQGKPHQMSREVGKKVLDTYFAMKKSGANTSNAPIE